MSRREVRLFEKEVRALLERSLNEQPGDPHLDEEVLLLTAGGELPDRMRAGVDAHLVACRGCSERLARLRGELCGDEETLPAMEPRKGYTDGSAWRSWRTQVTDSHPWAWIAWASRIHRKRRTLWKTIEVLGAVAIVVVAVLLAWQTGGLEFGIHRPEEADPTETEIAQARGVTATGFIESDVPDDVTLQRMIEDLARIETYPTWRAIAHGIGLLNAYGVPLDAPALGFEAITVHIVQAGDTWQSIASATLGDEALWPVLVLLNREWVIDSDLAEGVVVRVPQLP